MRKIAFLLILALFTLEGGCQEDKTFKQVVTFEKGFRFSEGGQIQTLPFMGGTVGDITWESITGKPTVFPPATHQHSYNDLTEKPTTVEFLDVLKQLNVLFIEKLTTAQINAREPEAGLLVYDTSLGVLKMGNGTAWKTLITGN